MIVSGRLHPVFTNLHSIDRGTSNIGHMMFTPDEGCDGNVQVSMTMVSDCLDDPESSNSKNDDEDDQCGNDN